MTRLDRLNSIEEKANKVLSAHSDDRFEWQGDLQKLLEELSIYKVEIEQQVEEIKNAHAEAAKAWDDWEELFENAPVPYILLDRDLNITRYNVPFSELFLLPQVRRTRQAVPCAQHPFTSFVHPAHQDKFYHFSRHLFAESLRAQVELMMMTRAMTPIPVRISASSNHRAGTARFAISDISSQTILESVLRDQINEYTRKQEQE